MSKKDQERAARGELHRDGKVVKMAPCPFPACPNFCVPGQEIAACERHTGFIADVMFILDHTRLRGDASSPAERRAAAQKAAKNPASKLVLPGSPEWNSIVKEAP